MTGTNWDNIGLVASDLSSYYDFSGGADGSSCSFEMVKKESAGGNVLLAMVLGETGLPITEPPKLLLRAYGRLISMRRLR